jgi:hypothetical protein
MPVQVERCRGVLRGAQRQSVGQRVMQIDGATSVNFTANNAVFSSEKVSTRFDLKEFSDSLPSL